ncbi:mannosyltransferase [Galbibacter sp. BG1]|uniref:mannosyltransferase n=1 Tax=Galbibacter sp. BG1 TaxID=1170699 RepID=UPI0015BC2CD9|nr:mannosyltransferase [Galbibacter sp. BG1]QLE00794.1 mannosyltransferase [Galbibacter sp. BG1]
MLTYWKTHKYPLIFAIASLLFYWSFAYDLHRSDFAKLIGLYAALFFFAYKILQFEKGNFEFLVIFGISARLIFLFATPNLSQDFYRFIWDGKLLLNGVNPYLFAPDNLINKDLFATENWQGLYNGMGPLSAANHSNYPPVNQIFFYLGSLLGGSSLLGNIISMRIFIILADLGILYFGRKILIWLKLPQHQIFWYFLNPFILIELTGNLHFEGVMLFFLVASMFFILQQKWIVGALLFSLSISVKLLTLVLLPLFIRWFYHNNTSKKIGTLRLLGFYLVVFLGVCASFLPFVSSEMIQHYGETIGLWFQKFEFNASIYYLIREFGFYRQGYNIIATAGTRLAILVFLFVLGMAFFRKNQQPKTLLVSMLMAVSFYLFLSTTVHPWYVATPLLLCVFTNYKFPIIWSLAVFLSYYSYSNEVFNENLWMVAIEYLLIYAVFLKEVYFEKPILKHL